MSVGGGATGGNSDAGCVADAEVGGGPEAAGVDGCDMSSDWCCTLCMWRTCGSDSNSKLGSLHTRTGSVATVVWPLAGMKSGDLFVGWLCELF
jgi:hypothetical protein